MRLKSILVTITLLLLFSVSFSEQVHATAALETKESLDYTYATEAESQNTGEILPTRLFLRSGYKLEPQGILDNTATATKCPNGYKQTGLFGFGILPFGTAEWKDVGTWKIGNIFTEISLSGNVEYSVWLRNTGQKNITNAALEFTLKGDSATIAGPIAVEGISIPVGQNVSTKPVSTKINVTSLAAGKSIGVFIRAKYSSGKNGGDVLELVYGAWQFPSYARIPTNAVKIKEVVVTNNLITVLYTDAFDLDWTIYGSNILIINGERNNNSANRPTIVEKDIGGGGGEYGVECSWPVNLKSGNKYNITVMLAYSELPGWSKSMSIDIPAGKTGGFLPGFETMAVVTGIVVALATFRTRLQRYRS